MTQYWRKNIQANHDLRRRNLGPEWAMIVSGSEEDKLFWQRRLEQTRRDVFRETAETHVTSVCENTRKGNFLGTFHAWQHARREWGGQPLPPIALMSMVFGQGKRFSPFTQALRNRKPAFLTPARAEHGNTYLCTADLSNLYSNLWLHHLAERGFRGLVVKWGDEAIIPGVDWAQTQQDFSNVDAIRFVWQTEPTEVMAREKDWVIIDAGSGCMSYQYTRQELSSLRERLSELQGDNHVFGVNLGSLGISYEFLDTALDVLGDEIRDEKLWVDWDPYAWMALTCVDDDQWARERAYEQRTGKTGIRDIEARYPQFYPKLRELRAAVEARTGRPFTVGVLDFGEAFWTDIGLHTTLRRSLETLTEDSPSGEVGRELFGIPHERDARGNIILDSDVAVGAEIKNSIIIGSSIQEASSVIRNGLVVGSRLGSAVMPQGGSVLFTSAERLTFDGPHAVSYWTAQTEIRLEAGDRYTTLFMPSGNIAMKTNESMVSYDGDNFMTPVFGNPLSFGEAARLMAQVEDSYIEATWAATTRAMQD